MKPVLKVKRLKPESKLPEYAHPGEDAALDIFSCETVEVRPMTFHNFKVGIATEIPHDHLVLVKGKSGHAREHQIIILGGVLDGGYRGEWSVMVFNLGRLTWRVQAGESIAQGVGIARVEFQIVEVDKLAASLRGEHGFGSGHKAGGVQ